MSTKFSRLLWSVLVGLMLVSALLIIALGQQGQRIRHLNVDATAVTRDRNQKVELVLGQPIRLISKSQVSITPTVDFSVLTKGESVVIQLSERLQYDQKYTITISKLQYFNGRENNRDLVATFTTAAQHFYYLQRHYDPQSDAGAFYDAKQKDEIYEMDLKGGLPKTVFSAERIQEFCQLGDALIVATQDTDSSSPSNELYRVDTRSLHFDKIALPDGVTTLEQLRCSPDGKTYGYATEVLGSARLYTTALQGKARELKGLDGRSLQTQEWRFAPDGTSVIANDLQTQALVVDGMKLHKPLPLGQFYALSNFTFDGRGVVASDLSGLFVLDIPTLKKTYANIANDPNPSSSAIALSNSSGLIKRDARTDTESLILVSSSKMQKVYESARDTRVIVDFATAPNDQYMTVTYALGPSIVYDGYAVRPYASKVRTDVIDLRTLRTVKVIDGFDVTWGN